MTTLFLLIPDTALREAVIEQIAASKMAPARLVDTAQAWLKQIEGKEASLLIIDETLSEKDIKILNNPLMAREQKPIILMLGGKEDIEGVTETFVKPFRLGHLLSRLHYYVETAPLLRDRIISFGSYKLEPQNRCVFFGNEGEPIRLTEKETALLVYLAHNKEATTRHNILAAVWGYDENIDTHTLETHIYQLRRKLDKGGDNWLINEAGAYRLAQGHN